jgi:hypothetical protein
LAPPLPGRGDLLRRLSRLLLRRRRLSRLLLRHRRLLRLRLLLRERLWLA